MCSETVKYLKALAGGFESVNMGVYKGNIYGSDTSRIFAMQRKKDVESLVDFWKEKVKDKYFELTHPVKKIRTKAFYNIQYGMVNFVIMADSNYENIWIIAQLQNLIDVVIFDNKIFRAYHSNVSPILPHINKLYNVVRDKPKKESHFFGFTLSQVRPYHHFYDHVKFFLDFGNEKPVFNKKSFFIPKSCELEEGGSRVFLFPNVIGNNYVNQKRSSLVKILNERMEKCVYKDALLHSEGERGKIGKDKQLTIWFGITGQKRSWLEQIEGCINIIKKLRPCFEGVVLYIDGMTAVQGEKVVNEEDDAVYRGIKKGLIEVEGVEVHSLVGWDYREKIVCCDTVDIFIANAGTGCLVPLRFVRKPGVLHSNNKLFAFPDEYPDSVKEVHKSYVIDVVNGESDAAMHVSYHIPWQHIFNLAAELLNEIKGTEITSLDVPPVVDIKKAYDKEMQAQEEIRSYFQLLENSIKRDPSSPSILRDVAFAFEKAGDIHTAMKIMEKAQLLRPQGPVIKRKLDEYRVALKKDISYF